MYIIIEDQQSSSSKELVTFDKIFAFLDVLCQLWKHLEINAKVYDYMIVHVAMCCVFFLAVLENA